MEIKDVTWEDIDWIHLAQDRDKSLTYDNGDETSSSLQHD